jgi:hypothetical protein
VVVFGGELALDDQDEELMFLSVCYIWAGRTGDLLLARFLVSSEMPIDTLVLESMLVQLSVLTPSPAASALSSATTFLGGISVAVTELT